MLLVPPPGSGLPTQSLVWAVRLRVAADEVDDVARVLCRRADGAGLTGPAGDALSGFVVQLAGELRELADDCRTAGETLAAGGA